LRGFLLGRSALIDLRSGRVAKPRLAANSNGELSSMKLVAFFVRSDARGASRKGRYIWPHSRAEASSKLSNSSGSLAMITARSSYPQKSAHKH
jgi:hypothetical protein